MSKLLSFSLLVLLAIGCKQTPQRETQTTHDDATRLGHEAAWTVAHTDHTDTIALQRAIIDARSLHDRYVLDGDESSATEFERAFADSLRKIDPQLADQIF